MTAGRLSDNETFSLCRMNLSMSLSASEKITAKNNPIVKPPEIG